MSDVLAQYLINSDIDGVKEYLLQNPTSCYHIAICIRGVAKTFNPNDELIQYLLSINNYYIVAEMRNIFVNNRNTNGFIQTLRYSYNIYNLFITLISNYSIYESDIEEKLYWRKLILLSLDELHDRITFDTITTIINGYAMGYHLNSRKYISNDVVLFIISKIINDDKLSRVPYITIKTITKIAVANDAPNVLLDMLLKYIHTEDVTNVLNTTKLNKPEDYVSFFDEDV